MRTPTGVRRRGVSNPVRRALAEIDLTQRDAARHAAMTDDELREDLRAAEAMMRGAFGQREGGYYGDPSPASWRAGKLQFDEMKIRDLKRFAEGEVGVEPITDATVWHPDRMLERIKAGEAGRLIKFERDLTVEQRRLLAEIAVELHLDPLFRELTIYQGQLYVEIDGWRRVRDLSENPVFDGMRKIWTVPAAVLSAYEIQPGDVIVGLEGYVKGRRVPHEAYGVVRAAERQRQATRAGGTYEPVTQKYFTAMALKRAEVTLYREMGFRVRGLAPKLMDDLPPEVWDAEGQVVDEELPGAAAARCAVCNLPVVAPEGWAGEVLHHDDCRPAAQPSEEKPAQGQPEAAPLPASDPGPHAPEAWMAGLRAEIARAPGSALSGLATRVQNTPMAEDQRAELVALGRQRRQELESSPAGAPVNPGPPGPAPVPVHRAAEVPPSNSVMPEEVAQHYAQQIAAATDVDIVQLQAAMEGDLFLRPADLKALRLKLAERTADLRRAAAGAMPS